jgi:hypothetical protein
VLFIENFVECSFIIFVPNCSNFLILLAALQQNRAKFFLDCIVYEETSPVKTENKIWMNAESSYGIKFEISLCTQPPPGFSLLFLKTDDALPDSPTSPLSFDDSKKRIAVEALASCYDAILLHSSVETGTSPSFRHDYFLLKNDVPTPTIYRLPEIPGPHGFNIGILHHKCGHYIVAALKESMTSSIATGSSVLSGYKTSKLTEGPCVCIFSTLTEKWICRPVSLPGDLTSWNWEIDIVLANDNSFWWVDLRCGILSYDVDQQQSTLQFVPLPSACFQVGEIESCTREDCSVSISNGELKYVHIFRKNHLTYDYGIKSQQCEDSVKIWSWRDGNWVEDYEMKFAEFWEGTAWSSRVLPKFVPAYPTMDPWCPYLVNFFLPSGHCFDGYVIGVDLLSMEMQYCGEECKGLLAVTGGLEIFEFSGI